MEQIFGKRLSEVVVKCSVFRQFAGGEDEKAVLSTMRQLATRNIGTILFYSAEQDIDRWVVVKQDGLARSVRQWVVAVEYGIFVLLALTPKNVYL